MAYEKIGPFTNGQAPALSGANLNHLEDGIVQAHERAMTPGPEGPQGPRGEQGPAGADGEQGPQGEKGDKGDPGEQGQQGEQGPAGADAEPQFTEEEVQALKVLAAGG